MNTLLTAGNNTSPSNSILLPTEEDCPKRRSDLSVRLVDGETVVLDRREGRIHQFNHTASFIWEQCNGTQTIETIATQLTKAFAVDIETAAKDVKTVIAQFRQLHLLESPSKRNGEGRSEHASGKDNSGHTR